MEVHEEHMQPGEIRRAILEIVRGPNYRPLKPKGFAKLLGIQKDQSRDVRKVVKRMVLGGELVYGSNHLIWPAGETPPKEVAGKTTRKAKSPSGHLLIGTFRRNAKGFGFVRPHDIADAEPGESDVFIPASHTRDAATGDVVAVELSGRGKHHEPGPRGRIVKVVERQKHQFVGTYYERGGWAMVEIDGGIFSQPIVVGDPSATSARVGDKVVLDMVRFPTHQRDGEGVVTEVLGEMGRPGLDTLLVMREFGLPDAFEDSVRQAAHEIVEAHDEETIPPKRHDATEETTVTIDPIDARDFDDAISLTRTENGHWILGVHIADVSHFVTPKSEVDRAAEDRATSVYLPDRVIPMLPEVLSNGLASLQPNKLRLTKTAYIEFDPNGVRVDTKIRNAVIRSDKRLTYEQVQAFLDDPAPWREKWSDEVCSLVERMHELAMILRQRRIELGAIELAMPELRIALDDLGQVSGASVREHNVSHQIIEEFMLAANMAVAETLADAGASFLRRVHKPPSLRKMKIFGQFIEDLFRARKDAERQAEREEGFYTPPNDEYAPSPNGNGKAIAREVEGGEEDVPRDEEPIPEIEHDFTIDPDSLASRFEIQRLLKAVAGRPEEKAVNYILLRSFQRAEYSPREEGHYALASRCYCHFTSPIRRYPDLHIHRLLDQYIAKKKIKSNSEELLLLGRHCSDREQRAEQAERELTKLKLLDFMSRRIGRRMVGVVTGVESFGLFIQGTEIPAEGLAHIDTLSDDYYRFDRATFTLSGYRSGNTYRLGDLVRVMVARVDMDRRELDFRVIGRLTGSVPTEGDDWDDLFPDDDADQTLVPKEGDPLYERPGRAAPRKRVPDFKGRRGGKKKATRRKPSAARAKGKKKGGKKSKKRRG